MMNEVIGRTGRSTDERTKAMYDQIKSTNPLMMVMMMMKRMRMMVMRRRTGTGSSKKGDGQCRPFESARIESADVIECELLQSEIVITIA
jgi:hypothetical protein